MRLAVVISGLFTVAFGCHAQPRCELAGPPGPGGDALLWRVHRGDGPTLWLYGTIHDAGADAVPPTAWAALDGARQFASELGDDAPDPEALQRHARLPFGQVLDQLISSDDWYDLVDALRGDVREDELRHARPWFAMTRLTHRLAPSPQPSMDDALADHAKHRAIPIAHLETWDEQLAALDRSVTPRDLADAIHARATIRCELAALRAAYDRGDLDRLAPMLLVASTEQLLVVRNERWLPALERYLGADGAFVAVGLGHLIGSRGLLARLAAAGFTVERAAGR